MRKLLVILATLLLGYAWLSVPAGEQGVLCDTDTDCARHCPPPADDPECDGGPQS